MESRQLVWAAAAVAFGATPHLPVLPAWIPALVLMVALWRIAAAKRGWPLPSLWIRLPFTVMAFFGVALSYHGVSGIEAGSALLLVMAGMKLQETRSERDRILIVLIGYFLLFATFLREQAIWSLAWLVGGTVGITTALTQTARRTEMLPWRAAAALSGRLLLSALPLAVLLFLLFPRLPGPLWALPGAASAAISGLSEEIEPGDIARLSLSDEVAFRVRFSGQPPPPAALYWRGPVLEQFDGRRWAARPTATTGTSPRATPSGAAEYAYEVVLEPQGTRWLLALDTPVRWSAPQSTLSPAMQLLSKQPVVERFAYRARSVPGGTVRTEATPQAISDNLKLPSSRNPRTARMARELREATGSEREFLEQLLQLFRDEPFRYTLEPPALGRNAVDDFLFNSRAGFCEHFASSFAVLARAGGVPARVVLGYQGGEPNPFSDHLIVRQSNAHAWVEVWLEGVWQRVDPTSAVAPSRIETGAESLLIGAAVGSSRLWRSSPLLTGMVWSWDAVNARWDRWVLGFGPEAQEGLLRLLGFEVPRTMQLAALATGAFIACMLLMGFAVRERPARTRDPTAALYREFCHRLGQATRPRGPAETPGHYAKAIATLRPDLATDVLDTTAAYLELRYGAVTHPAMAQRFAQKVRAFRPRRAPERR